ncbi:MAG: DUF5615 family PIN-like protein [Anaerolineae bacterium]|nr:DUF5615 family PIN-like protein [Anaerolineae bacterium]
MSELRFYFDESVELAVSEQLAAGKIDVVSAHSLEKLGDEDINHLQRATELGRVLCTYDSDFLILAAEGVEHAGIVYAQQQKTSIGDWVRGIRVLHTRMTAEESQGQVIFLSLK